VLHKATSSCQWSRPRCARVRPRIPVQEVAGIQKELKKVAFVPQSVLAITVLREKTSDMRAMLVTTLTLSTPWSVVAVPSVALPLQKDPPDAGTVHRAPSAMVQELSCVMPVTPCSTMDSDRTLPYKLVATSFTASSHCLCPRLNLLSLQLS
jgi:hypothetical protein